MDHAEEVCRPAIFPALEAARRDRLTSGENGRPGQPDDGWCSSDERYAGACRRTAASPPGQWGTSAQRRRSSKANLGSTTRSRRRRCKIARSVPQPLRPINARSCVCGPKSAGTRMSSPNIPLARTISA